MGATIRSRPDLVSRLMRERQVARFLVAPPGYGKTFLALEYAQVVFEFNRVMWIDARSPCFLRDLDKGTLCADVMKRDPAMSLVVFDDVPRLGTERADLLSLAIDALLEEGAEVMVLCHPSSDAFAGRQIDRICLSARDLMLAASERVEAQGDGEVHAESFAGSEVRAGAGVARAIPQLAWGSRDAAVLFAEAIAKEELPDEVLGISFMALSLADAPISWACGRCGLSPSQVEVLERDYPHLGIDADDDAISSVMLEPEVLARAYAVRLDCVARALSCETPDALATLLGDALMDAGNPARACAFLAAMAGRATRIEWLGDNGRRLVRGLCLFPAWKLASTLGALRADAIGSRLDVEQAWRLGFLGDTRSALLVAGRVASRANAPVDTRVSALALVAYFGNEKLRAGAIERLSLLLGGARGDVGEAVAPRLEPAMVLALCLVERFEAQQAHAEGSADRRLVDARLMRRWLAVAEGSVDGDATLLAGAILFDLCPSLEDADLFCRLLADEGDDGPVGVLRLEAYRVLGDLARGDSPAADAARRIMSEEVMERLRAAEREVAAQQQDYGALSRALERKRVNRAPYARVDDASSPEAHPSQLQVFLFGGIEVLLDGRRLDASAFTQTKMRALLAVLTMANGREVSRDRLLDTLWPTATERTALKNLYSNWAALKRTLSLPDGSCPFLHHVQGSYRIDGRLVVSDVQQVTQVCRALALEKPDPDRFRELLDDLNRLYRGELLPSEMKCDAIVDARNDYRSQVSDALVQASLRLLDMGEDQMALWFARSALEHERRQEDPYFAMMSAQVALGQREAALETYRVCSRALMRTFHIDPSQRMVSLYRAITEAEERF